MGNHRNGRRTLAGFFGLTAGIVILFGAVAVAALRPTDGLAWVQVPDLSPDLGLDAGLQTKPLKSSVVAEAVKRYRKRHSDDFFAFIADVSGANNGERHPIQVMYAVGGERSLVEPVLRQQYGWDVETAACSGRVAGAELPCACTPASGDRSFCDARQAAAKEPVPQMRTSESESAVMRLRDVTAAAELRQSPESLPIVGAPQKVRGTTTVLIP